MPGFTNINFDEYISHRSEDRQVYKRRSLISIEDSFEAVRNQTTEFLPSWATPNLPPLEILLSEQSRLYYDNFTGIDTSKLHDYSFIKSVKVKNKRKENKI